MSRSQHMFLAIACCAALAGSLARANAQQPKIPPKAPASVPASKLPVAVSLVRQQGIVSTVPHKPPVVTAVAPHLPGAPVGSSIIFVGGKPRTGSNAELNPQPIPPGVGGPVDPPR
jgi:hypothetical protein